VSDPAKPNIAATWWRSVAEPSNKRFYFDSSGSPSVFWVDLTKLKLAPGSEPMKLDLSTRPIYAGEVSDKFVPAKPFEFMRPGMKH
jgi:choloylglycine hydrolase